MVEIGRARVKAGNAPIAQKISVYPPSRHLRLCEYIPGDYGGDYGDSALNRSDLKTVLSRDKLSALSP
jgi:hypothetical protein